jgi:drug/metabolite transporter (DMT)-like permease
MRETRSGRGDRAKGVLLVLAGSALWAASGSLTKVLKQAGLDIYDVLAWRYCIGLVSLLGVSAVGGHAVRLRGDRRALTSAGVLALCIFTVNWAFTLSNFYTTVANAIALSFTAPLFAAGLAWLFLGERIRGVHQAAAVIGILGVAAIARSGEPPTSLSPNLVLGNGLALLSGLLFGLYFVVARKFALADGDVLAGTVRQFLIVTLLLSPILPSLLQKGVSPAAWLALLAYGVLCTGLPILMLNLAGLFLPAHQSSILALSEVPFAVLIGMATLQEYPSALAWAGVLSIIVAGGVAALAPAARREAAEGAVAETAVPGTPTTRRR